MELWGFPGRSKLQSSPECICRGCSLLVVLFISSAWWCTGSTAGSAIITATNQVAAWPHTLAATAAASGTKHARRSKGYRWIGIPSGLQSTEIIGANFTRRIVCWRLVSISTREVSDISPTHGHPTTASSTCLLSHPFHFLLLLSTSGLNALASEEPDGVGKLAQSTYCFSNFNNCLWAFVGILRYPPGFPQIDNVLYGPSVYIKN
jgi:hypothetical protein